MAVKSKIMIKILSGSLFFTLIMSLWSCKSDLAFELNQRIKDPMDGNREFQIYFATNRKSSSSSPRCSNDFFGTERANAFSYGSCNVNVPEAHAVGDLDDGTGDRNRDFQMGNFQPLPEQDFFNRVTENSDEVLFFVHGFNVRFEEAVYRAAQIKYDAKFQGPVVLMTWPAGPGDGFLDSMLMNRTYTANQINAQMTIAPAQELFLHLFSLNKKVHVVVHSMGHQIVLPALASISENLSRPAITELVLNAPDFPEREFKNVAPALVKSAQRVTLYCSPADNALIASEKLNGSRRIGMCAKVSGIDTINVNEIDSPALGIGGLGHGYYAGRPVIADLYQVLLGVEANRRLFIRVSRSPSENYVLRR